MQLIEEADYSGFQPSIAGLVNFLNSVSDSVIAQEPENGASQNVAVEVLTHIHQYIASPALKQVRTCIFLLLSVALRIFNC